MSRPHAAALVEDAWNSRMNRVLASRGWTPRAIGHTGYGSPDFVRILGRLMLTRHPDDVTGTGDSGEDEVALEPEPRVRGWRAFMTAQLMNAPVVIDVAGVEHEAYSDRSGYIDVTIDGHDLPPGWHEVTITPVGGTPDTATVMIVDPAVRFGLVSDIDDTIITTSLPRPLLAAYNTFVLHEQARHIVPGMAPMYRELLEMQEGAPIFYLSTGAWNTADTLNRFIRRHGYPRGPLLLTDWGPTNTGWFRSGQQHKRVNLHRLAREFPQIHWVLIGDDGQHDPKIYGDFARDRPDVVRAIGIRELSTTQQVLSHGLPVSIEGFGPRVRKPVPVLRAPDGYGLLRQMRALLGQV
ncbi:App1 family protein [Mobilicoccus caccae]|nr:phosphatase domain-containing protein [Mobilicoccus caccae]